MSDESYPHIDALSTPEPSMLFAARAQQATFGIPPDGSRRGLSNTLGRSRRLLVLGLPLAVALVFSLVAVLSSGGADQVSSAVCKKIAAEVRSTGSGAIYERLSPVEGRGVPAGFPRTPPALLDCTFAATIRSRPMSMYVALYLSTDSRPYRYTDTLAANDFTSFAPMRAGFSMWVSSSRTRMVFLGHQDGVVELGLVELDPDTSRLPIDVF